MVVSTIIAARMVAATASLQSSGTGRQASSLNRNRGYRDAATAREFGHLFTDHRSRDDGRFEDDMHQPKNNGADYLQTTTRKGGEGAATSASSSSVRMLARGTWRVFVSLTLVFAQPKYGKGRMQSTMRGKGSGSKKTSLISSKSVSSIMHAAQVWNDPLTPLLSQKGSGKGSSSSRSKGGKMGGGPPTTAPTAVATPFPTRSLEGQNDLVTCISVIDENGGSALDSDWAAFRSAFPNRPFCLLQPVPAIDGLSLPSTFFNDINNIFHETTRDALDATNPSDWYDLCDLDSRLAQGLTNVVLFVDNLSLIHI